MWTDDQPLTWTCHACREDRPDALIAVHRVDVDVDGTRVGINRRYCVDRPACQAVVACEADEQADRIRAQHAARQAEREVPR